MRRPLSSFTTVQTEGGLLPVDLLGRIASGDRDLEGLRPEDYHLAPTERLGEAATRAWGRLLTSWQNLLAAVSKLPPGDPGTSATRERWLLPLFQELGYGRLPAARRLELGGKSYAVSHTWQAVPIHLVGLRVDLDSRTAGLAGAASMSPHGLVQGLLNVSDRHLWGVVSNGRRLRILRDNVSLTRQAYVEFDLEAMMEGEVYSDFVLLWLVLHQSRLELEEGECWLEKWMRAAQNQGIRALESLRGGVEEAIRSFGRGFLAHAANGLLRRRLRSGNLTTQEFYRQLLRLVYRVIFLLVAEERGLLLDPDSTSVARKRYLDYYSVRSLRTMAERLRGTRHSDLLHRLKVVMEQVGSDDGCPDLGLPALGSFLWSREALFDIGDAELSNEHFLSAIRALSVTEHDRAIRAIDYKNLGSEELGSIYESLLELHPEINTESATFELRVAPGHERKTSGSYYTPSSLVQRLLDSALGPVLNEAVGTATDPEAAILGLKVCDPACGSGHFLIAAAHRIARRLASVRTGDVEPSPEATRRALRDVIGHCLYGVDVNPMAVELCKVSLWMEALEPGKPFTFLEHRILCGNSLLGTTPALLAEGIPDEAFEPIQGDDRKLCSSLRKQNAKERAGESWLYPGLVAEAGGSYDVLASGIATLDDISDNCLDDIKRKEEHHRRLTESPDYLNARLVADAWCAAFVWPKVGRNASPMTHDFFLRLAAKPQAVTPSIRSEIDRLAAQYRFFHWHLEFPDVFSQPDGETTDNLFAGWNGGFDVVLGNPPWERIKIQEKEWFAERRPDIASAPNAAARKRLIAALSEEDPTVCESFQEALRQSEGESHLVRHSGRYPLCGRGDINTYSVFAETMRMLISSRGRVGVIVPSGIATDDTTRFFFQDIMAKESLVSLYDFENRKGLFPVVDSRMKFCLLTLSGSERLAESGAEFAFFAHRVDDLDDDDRRFRLSVDDIKLMNPNTLTCPVFRTRRDAEITRGIYERVPVLINESDPDGNPWGLSFMRMFDMANDSGLFRTHAQLEAEGWELSGNVFTKHGERYLPLYEAKMVGAYDHRAAQVIVSPTAKVRQGQPQYATLAQHRSPEFAPAPRYWVPAKRVLDALPQSYGRDWLLGFANITSPTNARSMAAAVLPLVGAGHSIQLVLLPEHISAVKASCLLGALNSFVLDYSGRQKLGGINYSYFIVKQLPVPTPSAFEVPCPWSPSTLLSDWIASRVVRLSYASQDLVGLARECGHRDSPAWNEPERYRLRCELDAAYFHLYGTRRQEVEWILESFPVIRGHEEEEHGRFQTKEEILRLYDGMKSSSSS